MIIYSFQFNLDLSDDELTDIYQKTLVFASKWPDYMFVHGVITRAHVVEMWKWKSGSVLA